MNRGIVLWKWLVLLAIAGLTGLFGLLAIVKHVQHVGPGGEIQWDDFGFSVIRHHTEKKIGDTVAKGVFHVVRLEVLNHARRVTYHLDNHHVVLRDEDGVEYAVDEAAQRVLDPNWPERDEIAHGTNFASDLAFDVPADKKKLVLRISWGGPLIDFLDEHVFGPRDIALN